MNGSGQADEPRVQFVGPKTNERRGSKHKRLMQGHKFMNGRMKVETEADEKALKY